MRSCLKVFEGCPQYKKNPFKGNLCLSVCTPDPQKVIGIIENVRGNIKKKPKNIKVLKPKIL